MTPSTTHDPARSSSAPERTELSADEDRLVLVASIRLPDVGRR